MKNLIIGLVVGLVVGMSTMIIMDTKVSVFNYGKTKMVVIDDGYARINELDLSLVIAGHSINVVKER